MSLAPSGYDTGNLAPLIRLAVRLGVGARARAAARTILIVGSMIGTTLTRTVGATNYSTAAGTASTGVITAPASVDEADALYGQGSECALGYRAAARTRPGANVRCVAVADGDTPVKATGLMLFATTATSSGVAVVTVAGQDSAQVAIAAGDTATVVATAVAHAINKMPHAPVTATVSSATVTLTAKSAGPRGNNLGFGVVITAGATTAALNGGSASQRPTARLGAGTATAGSVADDITAALAAAAPVEWFFALAHNDTTNVGLLKTHLETARGITSAKNTQAVIAVTNTTVGNAVTYGTGRNFAPLEIVYERDAAPLTSVVDPGVPTSVELAAGTATARLYGDAIVGGTVRGELANPACNLDGLQLPAIRAQNESTGVRLIDTEIQQLLVAGITPVVASLRNPGYAQLVRCVTSFSLDTNGNPTLAVKDTQKVTVSDALADRIEAAWASYFASVNIAPNPVDAETPPPNADTVFPRSIRAVTEGELRAAERDGWIVDVEANLSALDISDTPTPEGFVYVTVPARIIPNLHGVVGELQQLA